ncbi:MAG TPA: hypothetical protein VGS11_10465 [Candidatus Bathyarchaeia archaeon]|nr:hypothetical protein [Candidatus Bathyarchaeia archaeon]
MPTLQWQKLKNTHDFTAYQFLRTTTPTYLDWEVIAIFYSMLHLVDAYLIHAHNLTPANHKERNTFVRTLIRPIRREYDELRDLSEKARYKANLVDIERDHALDLRRVIEAYLKPRIP